jgi:1-deoxy-D-xylulose-5-phosphate reductoisomerase
VARQRSAHRKCVVVLGSTGSVGTQALDVLRARPGEFRVGAISGRSRWELLAEQALEFEPEIVVAGSPEAAERLRVALAGRGIAVAEGEAGLCEAASLPSADVVLSAVSGGVGLPAAVAALEAGKTLALANKEAMVMGGPLLGRLAERRGATILPVDSEHSAVFQILRGLPLEEVERVVLTASGGPFRGWDLARLADVTPEAALNHPTWSMGAKITIDSANLMNKALEVIEARWLFGLPAERIGIIVHPQSIVHCLVETRDGAVLAHLGAPDMRLPIQYALGYPDRLDGPACRLDLMSVGRLEFEEPDFETFPALRLGYRVAAAGGTSGAVLSAANEEAVAAFLAGGIGFLDIARTVERVLDAHQTVTDPSIDTVLAADRWAREEAKRCLQKP